MNARCIAEKIPRGRGDGFDHLGGEGGRGVVVKVDTHGERYILAFPLSVGKKRTRQAFQRVLYLQRLESQAQQAYTLTPPRNRIGGGLHVETGRISPPGERTASGAPGASGTGDGGGTCSSRGSEPEQGEGHREHRKIGRHQG